MFFLGSNFALMINQITTYMKDLFEITRLMKENKPIEQLTV